MSEINVSSGVTSTGLNLNSDHLYVYSGGVAKDTVVKAFGELAFFESGAVASGVTVQADGHRLGPSRRLRRRLIRRT